MDSLHSLIALHEANERLQEIHELKGNLPEVLNKQKLELDEINKNQSSNTEELNNLNTQITSNQTTLNESNDKLDKYNDQLFNVTNNKEYEALILETDQLKKLISNLNEEGSNINSRINELKVMIDSDTELIDSLSNSIKDNERSLSEQMADTDKEEQLLLKHKEKISKQVDSTFLTQYTKLFNKYGQGMASVFRRSCNSCYTQLPPQLIVEIEYDKKIITCPSCSVFLYHKNEEN